VQLSFSSLPKIQITERVELRLQGGLYNILNTPQFDVPNTTVTSPNFGKITDDAIQPRNAQLMARFTW
jgi:hypothetical protein